MARVQSTIGAAQHYGPRTSNEGLPNAVSTYGAFRLAEVAFNYIQANGDLPDANGNVDAAVISIPARSLITRAYIVVGDAWTSADDPVLNLGCNETDGGTEDVDGIDALQKAALTAGAIIVADGDLVGASVGDEDVQLTVQVVDDTTDFTAGTARMVVEYLPNYEV